VFEGEAPNKIIRNELRFYFTKATEHIPLPASFDDLILGSDYLKYLKERIQQELRFPSESSWVSTPLKKILSRT